MSVGAGIREPLQGRTSLRRVFWLYGVGASLAYTLVGLAVPSGGAAAAGLYLLGGSILGIYQLIALWQCAYNGRSRFIGMMVRVSVIVSILFIPVLVYVLVKYPGMSDALKDAGALTP